MAFGTFSGSNFTFKSRKMNFYVIAWCVAIRLENEHLNNVGKYRAFKSVPLPFQEAGGNKSM